MKPASPTPNHGHPASSPFTGHPPVSLDEYRIRRLLNTPARIRVYTRQTRPGQTRYVPVTMFTKALVKDLFPSEGNPVQDALGGGGGCIVLIRRTDGTLECLTEDFSS